MKKDYKIIDNTLIINEGRTEIGSNEFFHQKIVKAIIPEGVTKIGYWAFGGCKELKEVVLPTSLEYVASEAFALCPLEEIVFTDGCPHLKEVHINSFGFSPWIEKQRKEHEFFMLGTRLFMHGKGPAKIVIPDGVNVIGESSFSEIDDEYVLEEVFVPEGVKVIENNAFSCCEKLVRIHLPDSLETIGDSAFSNCKKLKEIVLPKKLKSIGACAFNACSALETIVFPEKLKTIGEDLFNNGYFKGEMSVKNVESLIPALLNGCKLNSKTSMWFLENLWKDENSLKEIAVVYLTQSGTKVLAQAELILWRNSEQAINIMKELKNTYKLRPATIKKIDEFVKKYS